jgi:murein DD-endopeptidase MepM/ murein hydrolase activator NlpD
MKLSNISKWILGIGILSILSPFYSAYRQNRETKKSIYESRISYLEQAVPKLDGSALDRDDACEINPEIGGEDSVSLAGLARYDRDDKIKGLLEQGAVRIGKKIYPKFGQSGIRITSGYNEERKLPVGKRRRKKWVENVHYGLDMTSKDSLNRRAPIYATQGVVEFIGRNGKHGRTVVIEINKKENLYEQCSHFSRLNKQIEIGDSVYGGQWLGNMGSSGNSYGSHCHVERFTLPSGINYSAYAENMKRKKKDRIELMVKSYIDPTPWLAENTEKAKKRIRSLASCLK